MPTVTLTDEQMDRCHVDAQRRLQAATSNEQLFVSGRNRYDIDLIGCMGELAVALYMGREWIGEGQDGNCGDVMGLEVRTSFYKDEPDPKYRLIIRPKDKDALYVLCIAKDNQVVIAGWAGSWSVRHFGKPIYEEGTYGLERSKLYKMEDLQEVCEFEEAT
tara:strand:- start:134 stop:616 length:483 start_codon:yes stop_codon:yes gene_type:complete